MELGVGCMAGRTGIKLAELNSRDEGRGHHLSGDYKAQ